MAPQSCVGCASEQFNFVRREQEAAGALPVRRAFSISPKSCANALAPPPKHPVCPPCGVADGNGYERTIESGTQMYFRKSYSSIQANGIK